MKNRLERNCEQKHIKKTTLVNFIIFCWGHDWSAIDIEMGKAQFKNTYLYTRFSHWDGASPMKITGPGIELQICIVEKIPPTSVCWESRNSGEMEKCDGNGNGKSRSKTIRELHQGPIHEYNLRYSLFICVGGWRVQHQFPQSVANPTMGRIMVPKNQTNNFKRNARPPRFRNMFDV